MRRKNKIFILEVVPDGLIHNKKTEKMRKTVKKEEVQG